MRIRDKTEPNLALVIQKDRINAQSLKLGRALI